jgi:hypothetical protein
MRASQKKRSEIDERTQEDQRKGIWVVRRWWTYKWFKSSGPAREKQKMVFTGCKDTQDVFTPRDPLGVIRRRGRIKGQRGLYKSHTLCFWPWILISLRTLLVDSCWALCFNHKLILCFRCAYQWPFDPTSVVFQ